MNYDLWKSTEPADYDEKPFDPADDPPDEPEPQGWCCTFCHTTNGAADPHCVQCGWKQGA